MKKNKQTIAQQAAATIREDTRRLRKQSAYQVKMKAARDEANRDAKKASRVVSVGQKKAPKSVKGVLKRVGGLNMQSDLGKWATILSRPFDVEGVFCPVSYNPAPSFIQSTARTTSTNLNLTVTSGTTTQLNLWPGHTRIAGDAAQSGGDLASMDAVSYHERDVFVGGSGTANHYVVGPMAKIDIIATRTPCIGTLSPGITTGFQLGTTTGASVTPVLWDVALPYLSDSTTGGGHHSRWQLVSMGVRIRNTTPEIYRGGNVISVQPNNEVAVSNTLSQSTLEVFPTFHDHGVCESAEIAWIPRAQDLAFWHGAQNSATGGNPLGAVVGPGILIFFNNTTANTTSYTYEIVCHWQLAGTYLNPVGGPAPHAPEVKPHIEKALSFLQNSAHTASGAVGVISKAVNHSGASSGVTWQDAARLGFNAAKSGIKTLANLA